MTEFRVFCLVFTFANAVFLIAKWLGLPTAYTGFEEFMTRVAGSFIMAATAVSVFPFLFRATAKE